jgi:phage terminase large subunit-like protein
MSLSAADFRNLTKDQLTEFLASLSNKEAERVLYTWEFWARENQLPNASDWKIWLALAGRGFGKTRMGAEWVRHQIKSGHKRIACVAPTKGDVRRVMVEGESGLLSVCWANDVTYKGKRKVGKPLWSPTNNTLTWENGAKAEFFSAEDPERLRGPQFSCAWTDELAAWNNVDAVWDMYYP